MLQGARPLRPSQAKRGNRNPGARLPSSRSPFSSSPLNRVSSPSPSSNSPSPSPQESPISSPLPSPQIKPTIDTPLAVNRPVVVPTPGSSSPLPASTPKDTQRGHHRMLIVAGVLSGAFVLLISAVAFVFFRSNKAVTVKPWATGLSGQLQKAFVTGPSSFYRLVRQKFITKGFIRFFKSICCF